MESMGCTSEQLTLHYIVIAVNVAFIVIYVIIISLFIKSHVCEIPTLNSIPKPSAIVLLTGSIFCLVSVIALIAWTLELALNCKYRPTTTIYMYVICLLMQLVFSVFIWYLRVLNAFKSTKWALSKITKRIFTTLCISLFIYMAASIVFALIFYKITIFNGVYLWTILSALSIIFYLILTISLLILFIKRLISVYKAVDSDPTFVSLITKMTILIFLSCLVTIIMVIANIANDESNIVTKYFAFLSTSIDIFSNLIFVILSFNGYTKYYFIFCGILHNKCNHCWLMIVGTTENEINMAIEIK